VCEFHGISFTRSVVALDLQHRARRQSLGSQRRRVERAYDGRSLAPRRPEPSLL